LSTTRRQWGRGELRRLGAGLWLGLLAGLGTTSTGFAQTAPAGYFETVPDKGGEAQVEADMLTYDSATNMVAAAGGAILVYQGHRVKADQLTYDRTSGKMTAVGNVHITAPDGNVYTMDQIEVTGGIKQAFVRSMTLVTKDGEMIVAQDVDYESELRTILTEASYSPCGECIDAKGRRIGWKIYAAKITRDDKGNVIYLDQPTVEVLGVPVAWFPWLALPDPTKRAAGFKMPRYSYSTKLGHSLEVPYFIPIGDDIDLLLSPKAMTRQGFLMGAEYEQRFDYGRINVKAAGVYQLDPSAFAKGIGDGTWRGGLTASGSFVPLENWTAGFSVTTFTDAAFFNDYEISTAKGAINEVYATYLTDDDYVDMRAQKFNALGDVTWADQEKQVRAIPNIKAVNYTDLGEWGQIRTSARVLGIQRGLDSTATYGGVPYVFGYQESKLHATLETSWQKQWVAPIGALVTPYLGIRGDYTSYDGASALASDPGATTLFSATPIAALDVRFPLIASDGLDSHLFEPIAQLVYRGSSTTLPGVVNDNAQSFVFDDTNLFSYDRFSGTDRQETGLRANIGGRYMANFQDDKWLELVGGQSYHLAGVNGLGIADASLTGTSTGLGSTASYIVLGAQGSPGYGLTLGGKVQLDPTSFKVTRAGAGANLAMANYTVGLDYFYLPANTATGTVADQHEATVRASAPLPMFDYWTVNGSLSWDLAQAQFLQATGGLTYDDGFFVAGAYAGLTGATHTSPNALTYGVKFLLRTPSSSIDPLGAAGIK
jgi:LPS-assembly protein